MKFTDTYKCKYYNSDERKSERLKILKNLRKSYNFGFSIIDNYRCSGVNCLVCPWGDTKADGTSLCSVIIDLSNIL